jgi:hypothetical protein
MKSKRGGYNKRDWTEAEKIISENTHMKRKPLAALCGCHCQTPSFKRLCDKYGINVHKHYKRAHIGRESSLRVVSYLKMITALMETSVGDEIRAYNEGCNG